MSKKLFAVLLILLFSAAAAQATTIELITNGDFETGDMTGWSSTGLPSQWGVQGGTIGQYHVHASDYSCFAAAWGWWYQGAILSQQVDISSYNLTDNQLHIHADLIYSYDGINTWLEFYDSYGNLLQQTDLYSTPIPSYNSAFNTNLHTSVTIPGNTSSIAFMADGTVRDGHWLDAGIDQVSMTIDVADPVPEPATCCLLGTALLFTAGLRRKKTA